MIMLTLASVVAVWFVNAVTRPVTALVEEARALGAGKEDVELPRVGEDEVSQLVVAFTSMRARLRESLASLLRERHALQVERDLLATSEASLHTIFDAVACAVLVRDPSGAIVYANLAAKQLVGSALNWVVASSPGGDWRAWRLQSGVTLIAEDGSVLSVDALPGMRGLRTGKPVRKMTLGFRLADGEERWMIADATPVLDKAGLPVQIIVSSVDVTERVLAQRELQQAQTQAAEQERLRALGVMASGIAHDFNNALQPILGFSELLLAHPERLADTAEVEESLRLIFRSAEDGARVVRRLQSLYRPRAAMERLLPLDVNRIVRQVVMLARPRWRDQASAVGATISIHTDLQTLPPVAGDETELQQALINLVFNAVDAMPAGGTITLSTHLDDGIVLLEVRDNGAGMTPYVRQHCLEPFFTTRGAKGSGLGLAAVSTVVQRHGGDVEIESEPGKGTTICLRLPVLQGPPLLPGEAAPIAQAAIHPARVLVVEDQPLVLRTILASLKRDGHTVVTAINGREALARFEHGHFDLVLTDMAMPKMGGAELARAIKLRSPATPVALCTGFGDKLVAEGAQLEGVDVIISKPVTQATLRRTIASLLVEHPVN